MTTSRIPGPVSASEREPAFFKCSSTEVCASYKGLTPANPAASKVGRANVGSNTSPERVLRRALDRLGGRYRLDARDLPGKPDLVFRNARVAVFCDGDFWHGRDWRRRRRALARGSNSDYWLAKINRNRTRDRTVNRLLQRLGWYPIRRWETDILRQPDKIAREILVVVRRRSS